MNDTSGRECYTRHVHRHHRNWSKICRMKRALLLAVLMPVALNAPAPLDAAAVALRKHEAMVALDRYLETWNSRDAAVWATSLHFPHVRPGPGAFEMTRSPEEYVKGVNFEQTLKTGWHHSEWVTRDVLQVGIDKIHASGTWQRYTADDKPLAGSDITYVITRIDGRWGVQARFAAGVNGIDPAGAAAQFRGWRIEARNGVHAGVELTRSSRSWPRRFTFRTCASPTDRSKRGGRPPSTSPARSPAASARGIRRRSTRREVVQATATGVNVHRVVQPARSQGRRPVEGRRRVSRRTARRRLEDPGSIDDGVVGLAGRLWTGPLGPGVSSQFRPLHRPVLAS